MSANAIQMVSKALQSRLAYALRKDVSEVYLGPLDDADAANAGAVLFLYRLATNSELRNTAHLIPGSIPNDPPVLSKNALPLDLYYLITAGNRETGGESNSLVTLGTMLQALLDSPTLTGVDVLGETVRLTLDSVSSEEMSRIWTLFPTANYRTSVVYLASPVWIYPEFQPGEAPPVTQEPHRFGQKPLLVET